MAGIKIVDLPALGRDLISTDLLEVSLNGSGSRKITGQEIMNASKLAVGSTPIVSGTVGRLLFQNTGDVLGQSANLFWDNTNGRLGIGTSSPQGATHIAVATGTPALVLSDVGSPNTLPTLQFRRGPLSAYSLQIDYPSNIKARFSIGDAVTGYELTGGNVGLTGGRSIEFGGITGQAVTAILGSVHTDNNNGQLFFSTRGSGTLAERARITNNGNVLINTTTDAGFRLDVNGTARVQNTLTVNKGGNNYFTFEASANGTAPYIQAFFAGGIDARIYFDNNLKLRNAGSTNLYGLDCGNINASGTITLDGATDQKLHFFGSQNNFIQYTDKAAANIGVIGTADATSYIQVRTGSATNMSTGTLSTAFFASGNVGINTTTDAGYKLDVNGTARVQGPTGYSMVYDSSGVLNSYGIYNALKMYNSATLLCVNLGSEGANGRLELGQNGSSYIRLNGGSSANDNYIKGATLIGANYSSANSSSVLECRSTTQGFLPPRMTNAQRAAIASPAVGLIVYCTDSTEGLYVYKSTGWTFMV